MANGTTHTDSVDAPALALQALLDMVQNASSSEALEAQNILLRRLALQGDVTSSRVPAPRNITEIGGYVNLLTRLSENEMRSQALAGILGVAGPNPPLGWFPAQPPLALLSVTNDRPPGPAQPVIPLNFSVRSDFTPALQSALDNLHTQGALLPLHAPQRTLPLASATATVDPDPLDYLGRVIRIVPETALRDANNDPVALARANGSPDPFAIMARSYGTGGDPPPIAAQTWDILECTSAACTPMTASTSLVPVAPALATAGFYPQEPLPQPTSVTDIAWSRFTNVAGLIAGVTRLGDELSLLYRTAEIHASAFAAQLNWVWNGTQFAASA